jgi:hypothetical protein
MINEKRKQYNAPFPKKWSGFEAGKADGAKLPQA